jgi:hypothetical protein
MSRIGALKIQILEKEVTNEPYWSHKNPETGESGHQ